MSISRIEQAFKRLDGRTALIPYIPVGDPSIHASLEIMHALVEVGADIIELGVPFSDPMADGPVIQKATERAIANGTTLAVVLDVVQNFRQTNKTTPIVLMGYANPIEAMGLAQFTQRAAQVGVDGVLVVDYPPEEYEALQAQLKPADIAPIFLLAPTSTPERIQSVAAIASGYVYYVSLKGVTGSAALNINEVQQRVEEIKKMTNIPVGVGFGIRDAQSAQAIAKVADAVVIGSKLIEIITQVDEQHAAQVAGEWLATIRYALDHQTKRFK